MSRLLGPRIYIAPEPDEPEPDDRQPEDEPTLADMQRGFARLAASYAAVGLVADEPQRVAA